MAQRDLHADPYLVSGRSAADSSRLYMKQIALQRSIHDASDLERRGLGLLARSGRNSLKAWAAIAAATLGTVLLGLAAADAHDGTYEGTLAGNWAMLGFVVCIGALSFGWSWLSSQQRLRQTGQRLMRRAGYQRKLATVQLAECEHATVR